MKAGLTIVRDNLAKVSKAIEVLASKRVMVGVPADKAARKDGPINNAALAYVHNNGAPEINLPARPFMEPGIESVKTDIRAGIGKAGEFALEGRPDAVERQYHRVGAIGRDAIKAKITDGPFVPLAPATIAARKRKRKSRNNVDVKPLIDTGALRNSISYVIRDEGK
jgi:phage gpG-like protein